MKRNAINLMLLIGAAVLNFNAVKAQDQAWRFGLRLPFASSQLFDFSTPRLGFEFGKLESKINCSIELGMPVHANKESVRSKGYYAGLQLTKTNESIRPRKFVYSYGVKTYFMKGILSDYLKYEKKYLSDTYFKYELTEFNKTRLFAGLTFILRYKIIEELSAEYQIDFGYVKYKVNVPAAVVQKDYHNYYGYKPFYEGGGANMSLNLFYRLK
ncbi:MAG TPA: hypothetical protein VGF79_01665 [Bacteroidia bacterium]